MGSALSATVRRHPIASELPALGVLGVGALLVQLGITETGPNGVLSQNVWFNIGIGLAISGLVLAFGVPAVYVVAEYRRQRLAGKLADFAEDGMEVLVSIRRAFGASAAVPVTDYEAWTAAVESALAEADHSGSHVARFQSWAGLPLGTTQLSGDHATYEGRVVTRLARINEFQMELR
jgi:hypothetical protein